MIGTNRRKEGRLSERTLASVTDGQGPPRSRSALPPPTIPQYYPTSPNSRTKTPSRNPYEAAFRAPQVKIGLWRTATTATAHRTGTLVRLSGGTPGRFKLTDSTAEGTF